MLTGILAVTAIVVMTSVSVYKSKTTSNSNVLTRCSYALGTIIRLSAFGENGTFAIDEAILMINDIDDKMSAFKDNSDISRINDNSGSNFQLVSADTYFILKKAIEYCKLTKGAFDPTIRPLVNLWNRGMEQEQLPDVDSIKEKLSLVNYNDILFDENSRNIKLKNIGQQIDLGGIAKGFAADKVRDIFIRHNIKHALIDLGGNIYVLGSKPNNTFWNIGIQNPYKPRGQYLGVLKVKNKSIVTSGNYEKYFLKDGKRYHHIIDPKTGFPSESRIISATIISDNSIDGDGLSTGIYILGVEKSLELIETLENIDAILVTNDNKVFLTSSIKNAFELTDNNFTIDRSCD